MDHECNTAKKSSHDEKPTLRRWSNCFGLVNRLRRLKNRFSLIQSNSDYTQQFSKQSHIYPWQQQQQHSTTTIDTDSPYLSSHETIEHDSRSPTTAYHLSMSNTPTSSLSPPPRHSHHHIGRAEYTLQPEYCQRECQSSNDNNNTNSTSCRLQKMTLRLSLDTISCDLQHNNSSIASSPPDVASMTDSVRIYYGDDGGSTLHAESNYSTISNQSSLAPHASRPPPPCRSGTLGQYKTIKDETFLPPPLPSSSKSTASSSSIDLPLKERRRRRSPLMFTDNDKLILPIPRNDIITIQYNNSIDNQRMNGLGASASATNMARSLTPNSDDYDAILKSREKAMQRLEGIQITQRKVVSMARIAPTKALDEQMVMEMTTTTNDDHIQKQQQQQPLAHQDESLLTPSATAADLQLPSSNNEKTTAIPSSLLPTPSSFPPPPHHNPSPSFYLPCTPNSMSSSYL